MNDSLASCKGVDSNVVPNVKMAHVIKKKGMPSAPLVVSQLYPGLPFSVLLCMYEYVCIVDDSTSIESK